MQAKIKVQHFRIQEKMPINIVTYGICQEMRMSGPQSTLRSLSIATSALMLFVEAVTTKIIA